MQSNDVNGYSCRSGPLPIIRKEAPKREFAVDKAGGGHRPLAGYLYFFLSVTAWAFFCLAVTIVFNLLTDVLFG